MDIHKTEKRIPSKFIYSRIFFFALLFLLSVSGVFYTWNTFNNHLVTQEQEAVLLAKSASSLIPKSYLKALDNDLSDLNKSEYLSIKNSLMDFVKTSDRIRFAYFMMMQNGNIVFAADSEPSDSLDYSFPGQIYTEAETWDFIPFEQKAPSISKPFEDRWGRWISVMIPITDTDTGEVLAAFGLDYPAKQWYITPIKNAMQSAILSLCIVAMIVVLYIISLMNIQLKKDRQLIRKADDRLKESMTLYKAVFDQTTIGIAIADNYKYLVETESGLPSINAAFESILGRSKEEIAETTWSELTYPEDLGIDMEYFHKFKAGLIDGYDLEKRYLRPDGEEVWVHMTISPLLFENENNKYHLCIIEDISKRKLIERNLLESERSKSLLLDNIPGMIYRCRYDRDWTMLFISQGCKELTGYSPESLIDNTDRSYNDLIAPKYREFIWEKWSLVLPAKQKFIYEYEIITASGQIKWVYEQGQGIYDELDNVVALEGLVIDITDRKKHEERIKYINEHDPLTGLFNQKFLIETFSKDLARRDNSFKALIVIHIRRYSLMLTAYGYSYCESVTKDIAMHLAKISDDSHMLYQLTMDRFAIYVRNFHNKNELMKLCDRIVEILGYNIALKSYGAWVGADIFNEKDNDIQTVLKNATMAATSANSINPFGYSFYDVDMESNIMRQENIKDILAAICDNTRRDSFHLEYQPIISRDGSIHAFEALARINDKTLGNISPVEFIAIAEKRHLIVELGRIILDEACGFIKELQDKGWHDVSVSVNISAIQVLRDDFLTDLKYAINKNAISPEKLILEITESVFAENLEVINNQLAKAQILGIRSAIDDFGTGYSSLSREREIAADIIKIDKFFLDQFLTKDEKELITSDIINLAHKLGQKAVAEGIEHQSQLEYLKRNNCDYYQGYLFSKPVVAKKAIELLETGNYNV
ncbi:MAG: EAL domain-containing protein [Clostridia bacterium]|nr:EAL domain-containing protein [Clostridia bacterium]